MRCSCVSWPDRSWAHAPLLVFVLTLGCGGQTGEDPGGASDRAGTATSGGTGGTAGTGGAGSTGGSVSESGGSSSSAECTAEEKLCDGECVPLDDPASGCGSSTCSPCFVPGATPGCDSREQCTIAACDRRLGDCNGRSSDGCETNLAEDITNCGQCDNPCSDFPGTRVFCAQGQCEILQCYDEYDDCNGDGADGCEADLWNDPRNCGSCGVFCSAGAECYRGLCV